ncbi:MAG: type III-B CRISPR module-associated Cmr3 family protein, partial [Desulfobacca sp.]|uniref:type III-B CRISPR module-associated Cmr3 family protein n=1 Tax=Desulfobacca sp. TaxID=2067990 RepID=UPI00404A12B2
MALLIYVDPLDTCFFREARAFGAAASTFAASGPPIGLTLYGALGSLVLAR